MLKLATPGRENHDISTIRPAAHHFHIPCRRVIASRRDPPQSQLGRPQHGTRDRLAVLQNNPNHKTALHNCRCHHLHSHLYPRPGPPPVDSTLAGALTPALDPLCSLLSTSTCPLSRPAGRYSGHHTTPARLLLLHLRPLSSPPQAFASQAPLQILGCLACTRCTVRTAAAATIVAFYCPAKHSIASPVAH